jgi:hypothetical protein
LLAYRCQVVDERFSGLTGRFASLRNNSDKDADDNPQRQELCGRAYTVCSKRKGPFDGYEVWDRARLVWASPSAETFAPSLRRPLAPGAPLSARRRQTDYHVAVAFARSSHLAEPVYKLAVKPDPDQAVVAP